MNEWFADPWIILGFAAQILFATRFIIQWIQSERKGESIIPIAFWYFSIAGATLLCVYGIHRKDPVIVLGASFGVIVYFRNLILIARKKKETLDSLTPLS